MQGSAFRLGEQQANMIITDILNTYHAHWLRVYTRKGFLSTYQEHGRTSESVVACSSIAIYIDPVLLTL
jgi:hypothetical protein